MAIPQYVKFVRGTEALYNSLSEKDNNTLYFVYSSTTDARGKLYLGNRLISGSSDNVSGDIFLSDIQDIVIKEGLSDGYVLAYNEHTQKWESTSLANLIEVSVMTGATATTAGEAGLVPAPAAGDQDKFLKGDGTWATAGLTAQESQAIVDLRSDVDTLIGTHTNKSIDDIVSELLITASAPESMDSLQEIAEWIQNHPTDAAEMNADIANLKDRVSNVEVLLDSTNTNSLVSRVTALETTVGDLNAIQTNYVNISTKLDDLTTEINDRLRWHELGEE